MPIVMNDSVHDTFSPTWTTMVVASIPPMLIANTNQLKYLGVCFLSLASSWSNWSPPNAERQGRMQPDPKAIKYREKRHIPYCIFVTGEHVVCWLMVTHSGLSGGTAEEMMSRATPCNYVNSSMSSSLVLTIGNRSLSNYILFDIIYIRRILHSCISF